MPIYRQEQDLWRLRAGLFYFNSERLSTQWSREIQNFRDLIWPSSWNPRKPLVDVVGYALMPNHFHLILKEIREGGVSAFMHKFTMGYAKYINARYNESGRIFQGTFRARVIDDDIYLRHVSAYVLVKNPLELYPGGLITAIGHFDEAYKWAAQYQFCSLSNFVSRQRSPILEGDILRELFPNQDDFMAFAKDSIENRQDMLT